MKITDFITNEWQTSKALSCICGVTDTRKIRLAISEYNNRWCCGEEKDYICHSAKGYKKSDAASDIHIALADKHSRAMNLLAQESAVHKELERRRQINIGGNNGKF